MGMKVEIKGAVLLTAQIKNVYEQKNGQFEKTDKERLVMQFLIDANTDDIASGEIKTIVTNPDNKMDMSLVELLGFLDRFKVYTVVAELVEKSSGNAFVLNCITDGAGNILASVY